LHEQISFELNFKVFVEKSNIRTKDIEFFHLFSVAFFLIFTLSAFSTFYMLSMKSDAIFRLIESIHWVMLSSLGVFFLCYLTESTKNAIGDCSQFLMSLYSTEADASENINHKVDVCLPFCILLTFCLFACERIPHFCSMNHHLSILSSKMLNRIRTKLEQKAEGFVFYCCAFIFFFF
jgi:hypothetical protein